MWTSSKVFEELSAICSPTQAKTDMLLVFMKLKSLRTRRRSQHDLSRPLTAPPRVKWEKLELWHCGRKRAIVRKAHVQLFLWANAAKLCEVGEVPVLSFVFSNFVIGRNWRSVALWDKLLDTVGAWIRFVGLIGDLSQNVHHCLLHLNKPTFHSTGIARLCDVHFVGEVYRLTLSAGHRFNDLIP